eukprot:14835577-Ditylum_brightwellii.AAC.1
MPAFDTTQNGLGAAIPAGASTNAKDIMKKSGGKKSWEHQRGLSALTTSFFKKRGKRFWKAYLKIMSETTAEKRVKNFFATARVEELTRKRKQDKARRHHVAR